MWQTLELRRWLSIALLRSPRWTSASSDPSSSTWAAPCTAASTSPAIRRPTRRASAPTSRSSCTSSAFPSCATPAATSSPATTGRTASARRTSGRDGSTWPGGPSSRTSSASTSSSTGRSAGAEAMMAINLGTRGVDDARALVEYCNHPGGSYWSDLRRRARRRRAPRHQALVPGQRDGRPLAGRAEDRRRVRPHRLRDRQGDEALRSQRSSSSPAAPPTAACRPSPHWEATVLDHCYDHVDYLSLHPYLRQRRGRPPRLPRGLGRHGQLHRLGRRHLRLRQGEEAQHEADDTSPSTSGTSGSTRARGRQARSSPGRSGPPSSRTSTPSRTPSSSAASSSPCSGTPTG